MRVPSMLRLPKVQAPYLALYLALIACCSSLAGQAEPVLHAAQNKTNAIRTDRYGDPLPESVQMRLGTIRWHARGRHFSFSPDGRTILSCDREEILTLDATTGKLLARTRLQRHEKTVWHETNATFSNDCKTLATFESSVNKIRFWEIASGKLLREFPLSPYMAAAWSFQLSPD